MLKSPRAQLLALAVSGGVIGSLALAAPSMAVTLPQGDPLAGSNCQAGTSTANEGKIGGRGSTLQLWLQFTYMNDFSNDVCGAVPSDSAANAFSTAPAGEPTGDPTDPTDPVDLSSGTSPAPSYNADGMVAYDFPAAQDASGTGSTQGKRSISCRDIAFSGTDLPYANVDVGNMDGARGAEGSCTPTNSNLPSVVYVSPFQNTGASTDPTGHVMSFPIGVSAIALVVNLPAACYVGTNTGGISLSTADVAGLMDGKIINWDSITDGGSNFNAAACNVPVVRVVRNDSSGTTQGFLNYLNDTSGATTTCSTTENTTIKTSPISQMALNADGDQGYSAENNVWPGNANGNGAAFALGTTLPNPAAVPSGVAGSQGPEGSCSWVINSGASGAQTLLNTLRSCCGGAIGSETGYGGIGYADLSDTEHDTGSEATFGFATVTSSTGVQVEAFTGTGTTPGTPAASNCTFAGTVPSLPGSSVGLTGAPTTGDWSLDGGATGSSTTTNSSDDVSFATQGSGYPICSLTWDFVFAGEDGNSVATTSGTQTLPTAAHTLTLAGTAPTGLATSGTAIIKAPNQSVSYNGFTQGATTYTLNNVQYGFGRVLTGQTVYLPNTSAPNPNIPEPELNANQRRTLYQYMSYVLSDAAQSTAANAGYAQLPESWISVIRGAFQSSY